MCAYFWFFTFVPVRYRTPDTVRARTYRLLFSYAALLRLAVCLRATTNTRARRWLLHTRSLYLAHYPPVPPTTCAAIYHTGRVHVRMVRHYHHAHRLFQTRFATRCAWPVMVEHAPWVH